MSEQMQILLDSLRTFWVQLSAFLPQLIGALVILFIGWLVAKLVRRIIIKILQVARVDLIAEKAGIEEILTKGGGKLTISSIIGNILYWFIMFAVILSVFNTLNLTIAADLMNKIILYIPNVLVAVIVLILGAMLAKFVQGVLNTFLTNAGFQGAEVISNVARIAIFVFVGFIALEQLSIGGEILVSAFQFGFAAVCVALALAFGLGGRDWAARVIDSLGKNPKKKT